MTRRHKVLCGLLSGLVICGGLLLVMFISTALSQDWRVDVNPPTCEDAAGAALACANALAVTRVFAYTVFDAPTGGTARKTGVFKISKQASREAVKNSLQYLGHQERYPTPTAPDPTPGFTIPIK